LLSVFKFSDVAVDPPAVRVEKFVVSVTSAALIAAPAPSTSFAVITLLARGSARITFGFSEKLSSQPFISTGVLSYVPKAPAVTVAVPGEVAATSVAVATPELLVVTVVDEPPPANEPLSVVTVTPTLGSGLQLWSFTLMVMALVEWPSVGISSGAASLTMTTGVPDTRICIV
jgi:hypothetical protein